MAYRINKNIFFYLTLILGLIQVGCLNKKVPSEIQMITKDTLSKYLLSTSADSGLVIIMDVKSGKILADLAVVNMDSSNSKISYQSKHLKNESFGGLVQPFALLAALESGNITMQDSVDTEHGLFIYEGNHILDSNYSHGGYGKIEVSDVLRLNSDIGVFKSLIKAFDTRPTDYFDQLNKFEFSLPNKVSKWTGNSPVQFLPDSDYGMQLNPMQLLILYNAIANKGMMVFEGKVLDPSIASQTTISNIRRALQEVVSPEGTGGFAMSDQVSIAGKTGMYIDTTNVNEIIEHKTNSFCGYFPVEEPKFTCLILIYSNGKISTVNGAVTSRAFKELAEKISNIQL